MPVFFALLSHKITSLTLANLFRSKALVKRQTGNCVDNNLVYPISIFNYLRASLIFSAISLNSSFENFSFGLAKFISSILFIGIR
jgi:hypothetical protein